MEEIKKLLKEVLNREFIRAVISSPKEKEGTAVLLECGTEPVQGILKIKVRPLEKRGELMFQLEAFTKTQAFHRNLNPEAAGEILATVMEYGLLRERFAALVTDGLRAKYLESEGYETQVLEFIDMEHTPKNILLRAVRRGKTDGAIEAEGRKRLEECEAFLNIQPTLGRLLSEKSRHQ